MASHVLPNSAFNCVTASDQDYVLLMELREAGRQRSVFCQCEAKELHVSPRGVMVVEKL